MTPGKPDKFAALLLCLCAAAACGRGAVASEAAVVVVAEAGVEAYAQAVSGFETGFKNARPLRVVDPGRPGALQEALSDPPALIVALGSSALSAVQQANSSAPLFVSMVLRESVPDKSHPAGSVYLDLMPAQVLDEVAGLFPGKTRIAVIQNPAKPAWADPAAHARARQRGFSVQVVECPSPEELVKVFLSQRGKADFVLALPDSSLYNSATIKPLVMASLENRLPLIGLSAAFVRSGAAFGIFPDFKDIGAQSAEAALKILSGQSRPLEEPPRKCTAAVNQRVLRLLGLDYARNNDVMVYR